MSGELADKTGLIEALFPELIREIQQRVVRIFELEEAKVKNFLENLKEKVRSEIEEIVLCEGFAWKPNLPDSQIVEAAKQINEAVVRKVLSLFIENVHQAGRIRQLDLSLDHNEDQLSRILSLDLQEKLLRFHSEIKEFITAFLKKIFEPQEVLNS